MDRFLLGLSFTELDQDLEGRDTGHLLIFVK